MQLVAEKNPAKKPKNNQKDHKMALEPPKIDFWKFCLVDDIKKMPFDPF